MITFLTLTYTFTAWRAYAKGDWRRNINACMHQEYSPSLIAPRLKRINNDIDIRFNVNTHCLWRQTWYIINYIIINLFNFFRYYKSPPSHTVIRIHLISLSYHILVFFSHLILVLWSKCHYLSEWADSFNQYRKHDNPSEQQAESKLPDHRPRIIDVVRQLEHLPTGEQ